MSPRTAIVAMSYDPVEVLAAFADRHGITYPLLSDADSRVIRDLGLELHPGSLLLPVDPAHRRIARGVSRAPGPSTSTPMGS